MKTKLKQLFVAGLTTLALTYGTYSCTKPEIEKTRSLENVVLSQSSEYNIVLFGESHPEYRKDNDFMIKILPKLKKQRFEYLALELVRDSNNFLEKGVSEIFMDYISGKITKKDINISNYPFDLEDIEMHATGWLDMVDKAKEIGMKIIFYDISREEYSSFNEREEKSFKNLKEIILNKNPNAKIVVYCGRKHLNEKEAYDENLVEWEESVCSKKPSKNRKFKTIAYHLNLYTQGKVLTVSLKGSDKYVKYCDMDLDLDKNECLRNEPKDYGGK